MSDGKKIKIFDGATQMLRRN